MTVPTPVTVIPPVGFEAPPAVSGRPTPARATTAAPTATRTAIRISFMTCSFSGFELDTPPRRLARHNRGVRYQFVDCRWELGNPGRGRELYLAGHIPGASFLDVDEDLAAPPGERGRHPLPDVGRLRRGRLAGRDRAKASSSSPTACTAARSGSGGCSATSATTRSPSSAAGSKRWRGPLRAGTEEIEAARFVPRPREGDTIEAEELAARLGDPALLVLDARVPERFRGEPNPIDKVPGRIPGARNLPYTADGSIPEDVLAAEEIVAYCGSGVTACVTLFALAEAGRPDAKLYPGSWSEWERARSAPRARVGTAASRAGFSAPRGG